LPVFCPLRSMQSKPAASRRRSIAAGEMSTPRWRPQSHHKPRGDWERVLSNLWSRKTFTKEARAVRGSEIKGEMSAQLNRLTRGRYEAHHVYFVFAGDTYDIDIAWYIMRNPNTIAMCVPAVDIWGLHKISRLGRLCSHFLERTP